MRSGVYEGWVHHLREHPQTHQFRYRLGMLMVDLSEWDQIFKNRLFWSTRFPNLGWLRRKDHMGRPDEPLDETVRDLVESSGRPRPNGPIWLLTQPAYAGFVINPVSFYFCLDETGQPSVVVAEVNNTPWNEQHCYILDPHRQNADQPVVQKSMHVSPFLSMDMGYGWTMDWEQEGLKLMLACFEEGRRMLSVKMSMRRHALTGKSLRRLFVRYPFMTARIGLGIYVQAYHLWRKGVPFFSHPRRQPLTPIADQRNV
jgi:DUF1365 family protein